MGSGSYTRAAYTTESLSRGLETESRETLFANRTVASTNTYSTLNANARQYNKDVKPEMVAVGVRECRDSQEHPNSTPIIIALDVTGSMMNTPFEMIKDNLPKIMDNLLQLGVQDPQLLFMAIGDHVYDRYPIQIGQFESDTKKILDTLQSLVIEGGGGGNAGESYLLAHIVAGYHTETDAWFKRQTKGFLFTIGDEPNLKSIDGRSLEKYLGYQRGAEAISQEEAIQKAVEQYHVFHINITNASHGNRSVESWKALLGQNTLCCNSVEVDKIIVRAIQDNYTAPSEGISVPNSATGSTPSEVNDVKFY